VQDSVDEVIVGDIDATRAVAIAQRIGGRAATIDEVFAAKPDGLVIAAPTSQHAELIIAAVRAGIPTFCEKPVAESLTATLAVVDEVERSGVAVQIGFQRRFDAGYRAVRDALAAGKLGELRRMHLQTCDPTPPPAEYIPASGGLYRDCHIHDFDIVRFVSGREVTSVTAVGANRGAAFFADAGDIDESVAILTLDDGTLVTLHGSRYNGAGYDVRLEAAGTAGTWVVGLDARTPVVSAEPGETFPDGEPWPNFLDRFAPAYVDELAEFVRVAAGQATSACTPREALEALFIAEAADRSRREARTVSIAEIKASAVEFAVSA
jgi:myo-inositol 2-dehydrogenase/D-chiro-inositol 1-dehydrogenase